MKLRKLSQNAGHVQRMENQNVFLLPPGVNDDMATLSKH